ncbi:MAG TPA: phosphatidate cytidylyltransferase [Firmicutes bacterium]|jgi:dolichol kinase|nr:MAG: phosphatidate cytidylyltransferase [Peptococcaceae bacterium 1109]HHT74160.1 phosphatidate cytidylyltransferase [Bacillota bacterium]
MYQELVRGFGILLAYFLASVVGVFVVRRLLPVPREVFRKMLHFILLGSIFVLVYGFDTWWVAALATLAFMVLVYPILAVGERVLNFTKVLIERKPGEIKGSLVVACLTFIALITLCWGGLGQKYLVIAAVLGWGTGDAAAALVGKRFGRRYIEGPFVEGRKSLEGTLAMFVVSFIAIIIVLVVHSVLPWYGYVPTAAVTAFVCAVVELYTKNGMDTITCPLAVVSVLVPLMCLWGV